MNKAFTRGALPKVRWGAILVKPVDSAATPSVEGVVTGRALAFCDRKSTADVAAAVAAAAAVPTLSAMRRLMRVAIRPSRVVRSHMETAILSPAIFAEVLMLRLVKDAARSSTITASTVGTVAMRSAECGVRNEFAGRSLVKADTFII